MQEKELKDKTTTRQDIFKPGQDRQNKTTASQDNSKPDKDKTNRSNQTVEFFF
jgi:hypothetical protein